MHAGRIAFAAPLAALTVTLATWGCASAPPSDVAPLPSQQATAAPAGTSSESAPATSTPVASTTTVPVASTTSTPVTSTTSAPVASTTSAPVASTTSRPVAAGPQCAQACAAGTVCKALPWGNVCAPPAEGEPCGAKGCPGPLKCYSVAGVGSDMRCWQPGRTAMPGAQGPSDGGPMKKSP
ncbi:MAG: hypothetical protein U0441_28575 [Polyangiaceae bacterium]